MPDSEFGFRNPTYDEILDKRSRETGKSKDELRAEDVQARKDAGVEHEKMGIDPTAHR